MTLTVSTFKWTDPNYRFRSTHSGYTAQDVVRLFESVRKNTNLPLKFVCVTDDPSGIPSWIRTAPIIDEKSVVEAGGCFRRLPMFGDRAREWIGERFLNLDLDALVVGDLTPILSRTEDFIGWWPDQQANRKFRLNGSMIMMTAGSRRQVWDEFRIDHPLLDDRGDFRNPVYEDSDQAWINRILDAEKEAAWGVDDGVYRYGTEIYKAGGGLPANARIIFFPGKFKPWSELSLERSPWLQQYWS